MRTAFFRMYGGVEAEPGNLCLGEVGGGIGRVMLPFSKLLCSMAKAEIRVECGLKLESPQE
jgi:hypothetical protein